MHVSDYVCLAKNAERSPIGVRACTFMHTAVRKFSNNLGYILFQHLNYGWRHGISHADVHISSGVYSQDNRRSIRCVYGHGAPLLPESSSLV